MVFDHHMKLGALVQGDALEVPLKALEEKEKRHLTYTVAPEEKRLSRSPWSSKVDQASISDAGGWACKRVNE